VAEDDYRSRSYATWETMAPGCVILTQLPEEEREDVRREVEEGVAPFRSDGGLAFPGLCLNAAAS
jgi:hypothetical protein